MLVQAMVVALAHVLARADVIRPDDVAEKWDASGGSCEPLFVGMDGEAIRGKALADLAGKLTKRVAVGTDDHHVIDVADIPAHAQRLLHPVIEVVEVDVGEKLACEISDGHALGGRRAIRAAFGEQVVISTIGSPSVDQAGDEHAQRVVADEAERAGFELLVRDAVEILADVQLQGPLGVVAAAELGESPNCCMCAALRQIAVCVADEARLPDREQVLVEHPMHHAVLHRCVDNVPALLLFDRESTIRAECVGPIPQPLLDRDQVVKSVLCEAAHASSASLARAGFAPAGEKVL